MAESSGRTMNTITLSVSTRCVWHALPEALPAPAAVPEPIHYWAFYLYAIIKVRNDLRAIEILKSSSVPSPEVSFTYVPLSLASQAKKTILPSVIECIEIFILSSGATVTSCDSKNLTFSLYHYEKNHGNSLYVCMWKTLIIIINSKCICNFLWFKKLHFFLCTIMKKIMVTACTCACEKH